MDTQFDPLGNMPGRVQQPRVTASGGLAQKDPARLRLLYGMAQSNPNNDAVTGALMDEYLNYMTPPSALEQLLMGQQQMVASPSAIQGIEVNDPEYQQYLNEKNNSQTQEGGGFDLLRDYIIGMNPLLGLGGAATTGLASLYMGNDPYRAAADATAAFGDLYSPGRAGLDTLESSGNTGGMPSWRDPYNSANWNRGLAQTYGGILQGGNLTSQLGDRFSSLLTQ